MKNLERFNKMVPASVSDPKLDFRGLNIEQKGDNFIIEKADDPNAIPMAAETLVDRLGVGKVAQFGRPSDTVLNNPFHSGAPSHFDSAFDNIRTLRATRRDDSVARSLLNIAGYKSHVGPMAPPVNVEREEVNLPDDRPLIDLLHEATFNNDARGLHYIKDKYGLRMLLRKAHCFTLDDVTSGLVSDFSVAIAKDLESARRMAIPPFPVTWIDINNPARLKRMKELGVPLTPQAAGETDAGPAVERVGWLIHPGDRGG